MSTNGVLGNIFSSMDDDQSQLFQKIRNCEFEFDSADWKNISEDAKDFVKGLIVSNPKERWSCEECLRSKWIRQDPNTLSSIHLTDSSRHIKEKKSRLRSLAKAIMWRGNKPIEEVKTLAQTDVSETGEIV